MYSGRLPNLGFLQLPLVVGRVATGHGWKAMAACVCPGHRHKRKSNGSYVIRAFGCERFGKRVWWWLCLGSAVDGLNIAQAGGFVLDRIGGGREAGRGR